MKKIEAIVRTSKFEEIKAQLKEIGIDFFSYWDASGVGNEHMRELHSYMGTEYDTQYISRVFYPLLYGMLTFRKLLTG